MLQRDQVAEPRACSCRGTDLEKSGVSLDPSRDSQGRPLPRFAEISDLVWLLGWPRCAPAPDPASLLPTFVRLHPESRHEVRLLFDYRQKPDLDMSRPRECGRLWRAND